MKQVKIEDLQPQPQTVANHLPANVVVVPVSYAIIFEAELQKIELSEKGRMFTCLQISSRRSYTS